MKIHITLTPLMLLICCSQIAYSMDAVGVLTRERQHAEFRRGSAAINPAESQPIQAARTTVHKKLRNPADRTAKIRKEKKMARKLREQQEKLVQEKKVADLLAQQRNASSYERKAHRDAAKLAVLQATKQLEDAEWEALMQPKQPAAESFFQRWCSCRRKTKLD